MADHSAVNDLERHKNWRQGDFALNVGSFLYGDVPEEDEEEPIGVVFDDLDPVGLVVVSQTCDIVSPPTKLPTVAVCPLVHVDQARLGEIGRGRAPRFGFVQEAPKGVVADFGRPMSVSKELLSRWSRQSGFTDESKALKFAQGLERAFGRFAFPDMFNESIRRLDSKIKSKYDKVDSPFGKAVRSIEEIRVRPSAAWDAADVGVTFLLFFKHAELREMQPLAIKKQFEEVVKGLDWQGPFRLSDPAVRIGDHDDFSAREYKESVPLDVNALSFASRYGQPQRLHDQALAASAGSNLKQRSA